MSRLRCSQNWRRLAWLLQLAAVGVCAQACNAQGWGRAESPTHASALHHTGGSCASDADCPGEWCDMDSALCAALVQNGNAMPADAAHVTPVLDGNCSADAATLVCVSGLCDADNACGLQNGSGPCDNSNAATVCRSGVCSSQNLCGLNDGDAGCTPSNGNDLCQSATCSVDGTCMPAGGCNEDDDCGNPNWCDIHLNTCHTPLANGAPMPVDPDHSNPSLTGACTPFAAQLVCESWACDDDDACGYANGHGSCNAGNANDLCRSFVCGSKGVCGLEAGDAGCTPANANTVCQSQTCSSSGVCMPPGGCYGDADCGVGWCSISQHACMPLLTNGVALPVDSAHTSPSLDGNCTAAAAHLVCTSGVCDADNACGLINTSGPCDNSNAAVVCRSGACGSQHQCGLNNGDAGCTPSSASALCLSATCSQDGACMAAGGCHVGGDCGNPNWCDIHASTCHAPLANGTPLPVDPNHTNPVLDGNCTASAAQQVCASLVCDTDNACGYVNASGSCSAGNAGDVCRSQRCGSHGICGLEVGDAGCTPANAATVCQSQTCSTSGGCMPAGGCLVDADCVGGWCSVTDHACRPLIQNGNSMPVDSVHGSPTLDGNCTAAAGALVCVSMVCDAADNLCGIANGGGNCTASNGNVLCRSKVCGDGARCGYANTEGPCNNSNAQVVCRSGACGSDFACGYGVGEGTCPASSSSGVCRSGVCSANGKCGPATGCLVDGDCPGAWCAESTLTCALLVENGDLLPVETAHTQPTLNGNCTAAVGALVCASGVCDTDGRCGYLNGRGACTAQNGNTRCRAQVCGADLHCGLANGEATCISANAGAVCRSGVCSTDHACMPVGGCDADGDCPGAWCNRKLAACQPLVPNGGGLPTDANHLTPVLDGNCTAEVALLVCAGGVCDSDGRCGYGNGEGPCSDANAASVCRFGLCGGDHLCGHRSGEGPCSQGNAQTVCRGQACSIHASFCQPLGGCAVDADCGTGQFCDSVQFACVSKRDNGAAIPSLAGHVPALDGNCSAAVGAAVCVSGVCDPNDRVCGYAIGHGPCVAGAAGACRSDTCSAGGVCADSGLCSRDADCLAAVQYCDTGARTCRSKLANGAAMGAVAGHSPGLNGHCSATTAAVQCKSGVCGSDDACGYPALAGPCTAATAGSVCRSGTCSVSGGVCIPSSGCGVDGDCRSGAQWCNTAVQGCVPLLNNGVRLPTVAGHLPALNGGCTAAVGGALCSSGTCDVADDRCGYADGDGPCTPGADTACRSGVCGNNGLCTPAAACASDGQCTVFQYCDTGARTCAPKLGNGVTLPVVVGHTPALDGTCAGDAGTTVCLSGVCNAADYACGYPDGAGSCAADANVCRSHACAPTGAAASSCVACVGDGECPGARGVCDPQSAACVACTSGNAAACAGTTPLCSAATQTCVPCGSDYAAGGALDCPSSAAPTCLLSGALRGSCGRCSSDVGCLGHTGRPFCDEKSGACAGGCERNEECPAGTYCSTSAVCAPQVSNGNGLPDDSGGTCTTLAGATYCAAGLCDPKDGLCGLANGNAACTSASQCRSDICDPTDGLCGFPLGHGACASDGQCRVGTCSSTHICTVSCTADAQCGAAQFCDSGSCTSALVDGLACVRDAQCHGSQCNNGTCGPARWLPAGHGVFSSCASLGGDAAWFGALAVVAALLRRKRVRFD